MKRILTDATLVFGLCTPSAYADGVDLISYFTRVARGSHSAAYVTGVAVATDLIAFTLLGQIADRVGAFLAALLASPVAFIFRLSGEGAWVAPLLILNFLFSGLAVAALALYFLRRRWHITGRLSWIICLIAAVLTNPAWSLGLWFIRSV